MYSTPNRNLEKDVTAQVVDIVKGFEKDSKENSYRNFDATKLMQIEQERVYSLIKSAYGNNIEYIDYYNNNISDNSYEKYFTKYEKDVITRALGYKRAYEEKTGLYKSEVDKLDRSTLNEEEYIKKCEEIIEKIGESSWDTYQVFKPGSNSKINYEDYEKLVINEAKKRAVIVGF